MGKEWGGRKGRAKTIETGIKVQGAKDESARTALRRGFFKLDQPALMVRAAAAAATDTARRTERERLTLRVETSSD